MDAGFNAAKRFLVENIIKKVLLDKCGYQLREFMILGFGQGGMSALVVAQELDSGGASATSGGTGELGGVISIGAAYPLSLAGKITGGKGKSRTPVLLVSGRDSDIVSDSAVKRTNDVFDFVEVHRYSRRGDTMPRNRDEMLPIMRFFGRRLRSWQGVPEGSLELS
jgi:predicted esterase